MPEGGLECQSFRIISIDSLLDYENKYYVHLYLANYAYKIANIQMLFHLDDNLFENDEDSFLIEKVLQTIYYDRTNLSEGTDITKSNNS